MRDPLANVLGSIPPRRGTRLVHRADVGPLADVALVPVARWRPASSAAELAAQLAGATPAHLWDCASSAAAGAGLVDLVGGVSLEPSGGAVLERRAAGLYNGADFRSHRVVELTAGGALCAAATAAELDPGAAPFGLVLAFAIGKRPATSTGLAGKLDGEGWALRLEANGNLVFYVADGSTTTALALTGDHADGAWHVAVIYRNGATLGIYSDLTATSSTTVAGLGTLASGGLFALGAAEIYAAARAQLAAAAYYVGAEVAPFIGGRSTVLAWWADQVAGYGPAWSFARTGPSSSAYDLDDDGGAVVAIAAPAAPAWIRMDGPSGPFGCLTGPAYTPIVAYTDPADTAGWSQLGSPTVDVDAGDGPRLFLDAVRLGKTAGNPAGRVSLSVALTAGTTYHFGIWVRWDGGGPGTVGVDAGPVWRIRDAGDSTTLHVLGTSTVGRWHWHVVTYTAATTATHRIQYLASVDTADTAGDVLIQYASGGSGAQPRPFPGLAAGTAATTGATAIAFTMATDSTAHRGDRGSIIVDAMALQGLPVAAAQRAMIAVWADQLAGGDNSRQLSLTPGTTSGPRARVEFFDGSVADPDQVTNEVAAATWRAAHRWAMIWDIDTIPGAGGGQTWMVELDGAGVSGGAGTHALIVSLDGDSVGIGTAAPPSSAGPWIGGIQRARVLSGAVIGCSSTGDAAAASPAA